jgi:hypothetical protein
MSATANPACGGNVTPDYLNARLAELKTELTWRIVGSIVGTVGVGVLLNHFWK